MRMPKIPWKRIIYSLPVWAMVAINFTFHYALLMNWLPTYFELGLNLSLQEMGSSKMMPYLNMFLFSNIGGIMADHLITRRIISVTKTRKLLNTLGFMVASFALSLFPCFERLMGLCSVLRWLLVSWHLEDLDLPLTIYVAPRYTGIVMGVSNTASTLAGMVGVDLTCRLLEAPKAALLDLTSPESWRALFLIPGLLCIFSSIVFLVLSTGEIIILLRCIELPI